MLGQPDVDALVKEVEAAAIATETATTEEAAPVPQIVEPVGAPVDQTEEVSTVKADAAAEGEKVEAAEAAKAEAVEGEATPAATTTATAAPKSPAKEKKGFSIGGLFKSKSPKVGRFLIRANQRASLVDFDFSFIVAQRGEEGD